MKEKVDCVVFSYKSQTYFDTFIPKRLICLRLGLGLQDVTVHWERNTSKKIIMKL